MHPRVPELPDDLVDEILLRLPPEDPGCLFRASAICKRWRGLLTGSAFARLYRKFHRAPPLLGFFENQFLGCWFAAPSSPSSPVPPIHPGRRQHDALDSRHGLVLLNLDDLDPRGVLLGRLAVWDPLRRRQWDLPFTELPGSEGFQSETDSAAVLCAAAGCDHLDCRLAHAGRRPFLVACVRGDEEGVFYASLYSSEARAWSPATSVDHPDAANLNCKPKVLVGNALYFTCHCEPTVLIVRYDLASRELSVINGPAASQASHNQYVLVETGDAVLGFVDVMGSRLCLWSSEASADGTTVTWVQQRVVELDKLLPPLAFSAELYVTGFTQGVGVIVLTDAGTFTIELKSGRVKNVPGRMLHAFPYTSFYTPDQAERIMACSENSGTAQGQRLQEPGVEANEDRECGEEAKWKGGNDDEEKGRWKEDDDDEEFVGEELEANLQHAHDMFDMWSKAVVAGYFGSAKLYIVSSLECRFSCHGKLSPKCAYTYYIYGCTLLYKPRTDSEPADLDFELAWEMLHIARTILDSYPGSSLERVKIFSALVDIKILSTLGTGAMRGEDRDHSLRVCFKALAILEPLVEPENYWIIKLICLTFEFASNIGDAIKYCAKAISLCKLRISNLKVANEALLLDKGDNASAAEAGSERSALSYETEFLSGMSFKLEKKLEHLEQVMPTPTTEETGEQNVGNAIARDTFLTPFSNLLELLSIFDPVLRKTSCTPIWPEL